MAEAKIYLAQNMKNLRKLYGETQMELAEALDLEHPTALSNYENGTRIPKHDIRKKIAAHFRITEEQLMYEDLSDCGKVSFRALNGDGNMQKLTFGLFPIVCSESSMKNTDFAEGYNAHMRIRQCMAEDKEPDKKDLDVCFDAYDTAFENEKIPEAAANMLWWLMYLQYIVLNRQTMEYVQQLIDDNTFDTEFIKCIYLKSFDNESNDTEVEEISESEEFCEILEEIVQDLLKALYSSGMADIACYYMAIRYVLGMVKNDHSAEINQLIGGEMLWNLSQLGNKYAKDFLQTVIEALI